MVYIAQQAFGFGEVDPNIRAQYESMMYQKGCRTLENGMLSETGSARKRWGSVYDANYQASAEDSYQYVTGFGDRIMIYGGATTYAISSASHPVQTFTGKIADVAYRGPDLIVLTDKGMFRHQFNKSGSSYSSTRAEAEFHSNILTSVPPLKVSLDGGGSFLGTNKVTTTSDWFEPTEDGDIYRIQEVVSSTGAIPAPVRYSPGVLMKLFPDGYIDPKSYHIVAARGGVTNPAFSYYDWAGPYRNPLPVGKALNSGTGSDAGVTYGATIDWYNPDSTVTINLGIVPQINLSDISSSFDSDHSSALKSGMVGKFVTTYFRTGSTSVSIDRDFYVGHHQVYGDTTEEPFLFISRGFDQPGYNTASGFGSVNAWLDPTVLAGVPFTVQMFLFSSDGVNADGLPSSKAGMNPTVLTRTKNKKTVSGNAYYPVQVVGSPAVFNDITSTSVVFGADGSISSTSTASQRVHGNEIVGETYPEVDSRTFRIGEWEIGEWIGTTGNSVSPNPTITGQANINGYGTSNAEQLALSYAHDAISVGVPSAYWHLTGRAFNNFGDTIAGDTQDVTPLTATAIEIHQERTFVAGFNGDSPPLKALAEAQDLGLTIISSKSGQLAEFSSGPLDDDSISFIISSKYGGKISWLKSHLNTLFVGTGEEEFIIANAPIAPNQISVSSQSVYGSRGDAASAVFGSNIVFIQRDGKTIRSMGYQERRRRYESDDLMQFARHITKSEVITRIAVVGTATQYLFALTDAGKLWCLSYVPQNNVFGWSEWKNDNFTIEDILGTVDDNGNPSLFARTSTGYGIFFTSDPARGDLLVDMAVNAGSIAASYCIPGSPYVVGDVLAAIADGVYVSANPVQTILGGILPFPTHPSAPAVVVVGYNYTMTLAPNIPELMIPGKGSTLGREKNVSRLRVLFNQARGGTAAGYPVLTVPADNPIAVVLDEPGFHSIPVVGEYGPQPTINITQSAPYGFEISGYNAEYDFGD